MIPQIRGLKFTMKKEGPGRGWWGPPKGTHVAKAPNWSEAEVAALHGFTWLASETINSELREGKLSTRKPFGMMSNEEHVDLIDSAIAKMPATKKDQTLYSRMDAVYLKRVGEFEAGKIISNPSYISATTIKGGRAPYPGASYLMEATLELRIPKGTKGVLPLRGVSHYPQEKEHLIHRGSKYRIDKIIKPYHSYIDPWIIQATLLG